MKPRLGSTTVLFCFLLAGSAQAQTQTQKLMLANPATEDRFGWAVDAQGDTLVVSATQDFQSGGPGAAHVFVRSGGAWVERAKLFQPAPQADDTFGSDVAIDGDTIAIGATAVDTEGGPNAGAVYIYVRDAAGTPDVPTDDTWPLQARIIPNDATPFDLFGISVHLQGDVLLVGAWGDSVFGPISGSAYVFRRSGTAWIQEAKLYSSDPANGDRFGVDVAIDGNRLIVGANGDTAFRGAAYIFENVGGLWVERAKLSPPAAAGAAQFGRRVAIQGDTFVVCGAEENSAAGAAYVYRWNGTTFLLEWRVVASDRAANHRFGASVGLRGNLLAIGAQQFNSGNGAVYLFERGGAGWSEVRKVTASDGAFSDIFGFSLAIDGNRFFVGAPLEDEAASPDGGAVYAFELRTLQEQFDDLGNQIENLIDSGVLNGGQGNSLLAKLDAAVKQAGRGNTNAAINMLEALINEVEAMAASGLLPAETAEALIDAAGAILDRLRETP